MAPYRHRILITFRFGRAYRFRITGRMCLYPLLALGLPLSYCLSIGPVAWLVQTYDLNSDPAVIEILGYYYMPLVWCMGYSETFTSVMQWYQMLWVS
ncbi:MAG: hypothetical protein SFV23_01320 [Planctomycetaceae bacterium]|nr:hypothetical protein [Planctomycetaceae bacterium]